MILGVKPYVTQYPCTAFQLELCDWFWNNGTVRYHNRLVVSVNTKLCGLRKKERPRKVHTAE